MTPGSAFHDPFAELVVVGCAVDNPHASNLAHHRVDVDDLYDPALARIFAATPDLPIVAPDHGRDPDQPMLWEQRVARAAELAQVAEPEIRRLLAARPVMCDENGHYATRVTAAAARRRRRQQLLDELAHLEATA